MTIRRGETIAVDLQNSYGPDRREEWQDFNVSDQSVLGTVLAPTRRDWRYRTDRGVYQRDDIVAVYRTLKTGQSTISAVLLICGAPFGCQRGHRWKVTVKGDLKRQVGFQTGQKFKTRYATGVMWPVAFALKELGAAEEARIGALVTKALR